MQSKRSKAWDYLIVTAANEQQATAYQGQIRRRRACGRLAEVGQVLVVPDPGGRRVGSGGSTYQCLLEVLRRETGSQGHAVDYDLAVKAFGALRVLIVHAGGDSRRLPAYSPCGKIFVPLPCAAADEIPPTIFDRLVPVFLAMPEGPAGKGQIVVASGDALLLFDSSAIDCSRSGITALGARVAPETAARHGVFLMNTDGTVRLFLQKPSAFEQMEAGAIDGSGRSVLDIGVMSMDARAAGTLLEALGKLSAQAVLAHGIDLYREVFCALGTEATAAHHLTSTRSNGSRLETSLIRQLFDALRSIPCNVQVLSRCDFLHFGSTNQLISSGARLFTLDCGKPPSRGVLAITNELGMGGKITGGDCWVEGCRVYAPLTLRGRNVVVGVDVGEPLTLPEGGCLDIVPGIDRQGLPVSFIRYYGADDTFKDTVADGATFCGTRLNDWLCLVGAKAAQIWSDETPEDQRTLWNARVFPAEKEHQAYRQWSWMLEIEKASPEQKRAFIEADRYSSAEIAVNVNQNRYHSRRAAIAEAAMREPTKP